MELGYNNIVVVVVVDTPMLSSYALSYSRVADGQTNGIHEHSMRWKDIYFIQCISEFVCPSVFRPKGDYGTYRRTDTGIIKSNVMDRHVLDELVNSSVHLDSEIAGN